MASEPFDDIANAIYGLRAAFIKHGMKPPKSLELGSIEDKRRFLYLMPRDLVLPQPRMGETQQDAEWVCNIFGIEVRLPAEWRRDFGGKSRLV